MATVVDRRPAGYARSMPSKRTAKKRAPRVDDQAIENRPKLAGEPDPASEPSKSRRWKAPGSRVETETILESAALDLLAENGLLAGLNLREVADHVGVNRGLVYHYFGSRRDLLRSALRRRGRDLMTRVREHRGGLPFVKRVTDDLRLVAEDPEGYRITMMLVLDGDTSVRVLPLKEQSLSFLADDLAKGDIPGGTDIEALYLLAVSATVGYALLRDRFAAELHVPVKDLDTRVPQTFETVLTAFSAGTPAPRRKAGP